MARRDRVAPVFLLIYPLIFHIDRTEIKCYYFQKHEDVA